MATLCGAKSDFRTPVSFVFAVASEARISQTPDGSSVWWSGLVLVGHSPAPTTRSELTFCRVDTDTNGHGQRLQSQYSILA